jgi:hypothetical protein
MRIILILLIIFSFLSTACSLQQEPKLCKVIIPEPSKAELAKYKNFK